MGERGPGGVLLGEGTVVPASPRQRAGATVPSLGVTDGD